MGRNVIYYVSFPEKQNLFTKLIGFLKNCLKKQTSYKIY